MRKGCFCPLIKKDCIENKCAWYAQLRGVNPNTGQEVDEWQCTVTLLPILLLENSNQQRGTSAAIESFRNESLNKSDVLNQIFHRMAYQVEPASIVEVLPESKSN